MSFRRAQGEGSAMTRPAVSTDQAPPAIGPYSQAIVANGFVFCSGTVGIDPVTGSPGAGIEAQTQLALRNWDTILTAVGASLSTVIKTTIFYAHVEDLPRSTRSTPAHAKSCAR